MRERTTFSVFLHDSCSGKDSSLRDLVTKSRTTEANSSWCEVYSWSASSITNILWFAMYLPNSMASLTGISSSLEPWTVKTLQFKKGNSRMTQILQPIYKWVSIISVWWRQQRLWTCHWHEKTRSQFLNITLRNVLNFFTCSFVGFHRTLHAYRLLDDPLN